jgi:hypothetical protein
VKSTYTEHSKESLLFINLTLFKENVEYASAEIKSIEEKGRSPI